MTGYTTTIGNRLTADGTYTYSYDNDGNMIGRTRTSDSQVTTFTYDFRNRLTEELIKTSSGTTVQDDKFTYDVENRRIGKNTLSGGQAWTGYDGANPYADFNSSGSLTYRYLYGNAIDFLLARADTSGTPMWYLTDKLGSVREDVSTSGSVLDSITYDSYGNILTESSSSNGDRFKFTSREWDSEIGQYYYRARYYSPGIGRFESEDPLGLFAGDSNLYRYVHDQVTTRADPSGLEDVEVDGIFIWVSAVNQDRLRQVYERKEGVKLFGGSVRLDYFVWGKGAMQMGQLGFKRTVFDYTDRTVNGQLVVDDNGKVERPDGPNPNPPFTVVKTDNKGIKGAWLYDNIDAPGYYLKKDFLPGKKKATYTFKVYKNNQVVKEASITVTIVIDKDGKVTTSPPPSIIPVGVSLLGLSLSFLH